MAVLLLAEIAGGALALDATAKAVTAAKSLGDVTVLVAGPAAAGEAASKIDGVAKVLVADDAAYANGLAEPVADGLVELRDDALILLPQGQLMMRNVAMAFDAYLGGEQRGRFSRTV